MRKAGKFHTKTVEAELRDEAGALEILATMHNGARGKVCKTFVVFLNIALMQSTIAAFFNIY